MAVIATVIGISVENGIITVEADLFFPDKPTSTLTISYKASYPLSHDIEGQTLIQQGKQDIKAAHKKLKPKAQTIVGADISDV